MKVLYLLSALLSLGWIATAQTSKSSFQKDSLFVLGSRYLRGNFVAPDEQKSKAYLLASAKTGNYFAMNLLGDLYAMKKDPKQVQADSAIYWYTQAAGLGSGIAFHKLGRIYHEGLYGTAQDFGIAARYFAAGMKLGDANSKNMVAYYHYKGLHQQQDYTTAFSLYRELSIQERHKNAMYFLGILYRNGYGTPRNADSARYWLQQAAGKHYLPAVNELKAKTPENPETAIILPVKAQPIAGNTLYRRIRHNVQEASLPGTYTGFAARYDWSGQYIVSVFPLQVSIKREGKKVTGAWIEGTDTALLQAALTDSNLVFSKTEYSKLEHYTPRGPEAWQFNNARLNLLLQPDSLYIAGNLQLYSLARKEPGHPMYVYLSRAATADEKAITHASSILDVRAAPNPTTGLLKVNFTITRTQKVSITVLDLQGRPILKEEAGFLAAGTYQRDLMISSKVAQGAYALVVQAGHATKQLMIVKQ
ncbi:T9SS type A sorting domain-containing protein [Pseudoflavitalea sp. X16]|uniref:T9SS type A sorting domain-containing protein n=1 Tax=Paraflavitalea devenefica TaxID=2716334 RepID=UPI0014233DF2|nr:T9SS type A sorting domain-containing protein [Paraflavitalea devenefica]NII29262.1 T9SS type A sorting domain-containing protein [Paraflavitalea devenefica]